MEGSQPFADLFDVSITGKIHPRIGLRRGAGTSAPATTTITLRRTSPSFDRSVALASNPLFGLRWTNGSQRDRVAARSGLPRIDRPTAWSPCSRQRLLAQKRRRHPGHRGVKLWAMTLRQSAARQIPAWDP